MIGLIIGFIAGFIAASWCAVIVLNQKSEDGTLLADKFHITRED
jgi:hypothetical protein